MKIAFITRSTFFTVPGGDTIQVTQTVSHLEKAGVQAIIFLTNQPVNYADFDLLYFTNITRPADILFHIRQSKKPFIVNPILIDYNEFDRNHRKGLSGQLLRLLPENTNEYIKTIARWIRRKDTLQSKDYLWRGQFRSICKIISEAAAVIPGSESEYKQLSAKFGSPAKYTIIPNGIEPSAFQLDRNIKRNDTLVLCAARIEGIKNQLNLIKALNNTHYTLLLIGSSAPNQHSYYRECRRIAANNIHFHDHLPQHELAAHYQSAKVHALPSWFETCGLSSMEAAAMGCNIVITSRGYTRDYFGAEAFYCDPSNPASIYDAIDQAAHRPSPENLQSKIFQHYTWQQAADLTLHTCKNII